MYQHMVTRVEFVYRSEWSLRNIDFDDLAALGDVYNLLALILKSDQDFDIGLIFPDGRVRNNIS